MILGGIIVLLLAVLFFQSKDKMHYEIPKLDVISPDQITRIDIVKKDETIQLEKKAGSWNISPQQYPTDSGVIDSVVKTVTGLNLTDMASETQNYAMYGLDQKSSIGIRVYKDADVVRSFNIGNGASTNSHTYVRIEQDPKVYLASGNFRRDFEKKVDDFRDKVVMKFDKNEIQEITVSKGEETFHAVKKVQAPEEPAEKKEDDASTSPEEVVEWIMDDGQAANKNQLDSILNQLQSISCANYIEGQSKEDLVKPIYRIQLKGAKDYSITIFDQTGEDEKKYPAVSSENNYPFMFSSYSGENIMKKIEDLKKEEDRK